MVLNLGVMALAALVPILVGFVWYNSKVFGNAWMKVNNFKQSDVEGANMPIILGLTYVFSFMMTLVIGGLVIHQNGMASLFVENPESADLAMMLEKYGMKYRTFGHGVFHGIFTSITFVLPVIGINALFERRGGKYIFLHFGYWLVSLALMGGIICQFS